MGVRLRRLDWYIAVVGLVTLLWVCWSGKGLLYDLQYDLPASRFAHPDGSYSVSQDDDFQSDRSDGPGPVRMVAKAHNLMELDQSFEGTGDAPEVFMRDASMKLSAEYKETFEVNETHFELFRKDGTGKGPTALMVCYVIDCVSHLPRKIGKACAAGRDAQRLPGELQEARQRYTC